jgi:hypothetical protein
VGLRRGVVLGGIPRPTPPPYIHLGIPQGPFRNVVPEAGALSALVKWRASLFYGRISRARVVHACNRVQAVEHGNGGELPHPVA